MVDKKPELLAPVGSMDSFYAAIHNGCDAIYLGGKSFSARAYAPNFSDDELKEVLDYAHLFGVRVYVTVNTLYKDVELVELMRFIAELYHAGVDAVILQDVGVAQVIHETYPDLDLHASTQMTVHNLEGARHLERLGFSRVVLARELTLEEVREIVTHTNLEVETFIHGALCVCYSGQCLLSSLIGGRSGNRGRCAQPCRLPYQLVDRTTGQVLTAVPDPQYLLSPKDINTLQILPELIHAGIVSFKMEGRMKRPEYTASITRIYRKYIDQAFLHPRDYSVEPKDIEEVMQVFNRGGFSTGYYQGKSGSKLMSYLRPKNWGVPIGQVVGYNEHQHLCTVKLTGELTDGDGVEIWTSKGDNPGTTVYSMKKREDLITFSIKGSINKGDVVYRTSQKSLLDELSKSCHTLSREIEIFGQISLHPGEPMSLHFWDQEGNYIQVHSDELVEYAQNRPLTVAKISEQISKLGNYPLRLVDLQVDLEGDIFVPISALNALRREGIERLIQARIRYFRQSRVSAKNQLPRLNDTIVDNDSQTPLVCVYLRGSHFDPLKFASLGVDRICLDLARVEVDLLKQLKVEYPKTQVFALLPRIAKNKEMEWVKAKLQELSESELDGLYVSNLGEVGLAVNNHWLFQLNFPLNIMNHWTALYWESQGASGITLSPELNLKELLELRKKVRIPTEVVVYGYLPAMESEYCPGNILKAHSTCQLGIPLGLLDRKGMIFPVMTDCQNCRSVILNSKPLFLLDQLEQVIQGNFAILRLDLSIESEREGLELVRQHVKRVRMPKKALTEAMLSVVNSMQKNGFTRGHFYRGVE